MQNMTFDQALLQAKSSMKNGELDHAKYLFEEVLKKTPKNKIAKRGLRQVFALSNKNRDPNHAEFHKMFAEGEFQTLIECFGRSNKKLSQDPEILTLVGATNYRLSLHDAAEKHLRDALEIKPSSFSTLNALGAVQHAKGDFDAALATYNECLNIPPDSATVFYNIGRVFYELNDFKTCQNFLSNAIQLEPNYYSAHILLGQLFHLQGRRNEAFKLFLLAVSLDSSAPDAYKAIAGSLEKNKFHSPNPELLPILEKIITNRWYSRLSDIAPAVISLVKLDHTFKAILLGLDDVVSEPPLEKVVEIFSKYPMLLCLMANVPIGDFQIEQLLRAMRSAFLFQRERINKTLLVNNFASTLAMQCFLNEYLYFECGEETTEVNSLEQKLKLRQSQGEIICQLEVAILASYRPLYKFEWFDHKNMISSLKDLIDLQCVEPIVEEKIKGELKSLAVIENPVSCAVMEQYEENPYPRWHEFHRPASRDIKQYVNDLKCRLQDHSFLDTKAPEILIAGCGTGQQAINTAALHKNSKVIAVDLSKASLAYAKRKSAELKFDNIQFFHGDILKLGLLGKEFDLVECSGVLHHLDEPMDGWRELLKCLRPGGLMNIALYSEQARNHIAKIRNEIFDMGISASLDDIRVFRNFLASSDEPHHLKILNSGDFYSYSAIRDLLFHVQEHCFTVPEIKQCLESLGLVFCGFINWRHLLNRLDLRTIDSSIYDLDWWDEKERECPDMFAGMYQMICQKPI